MGTWRQRLAGAALVLAGLVAASTLPGSAAGHDPGDGEAGEEEASLPPGFHEQVAFDGLTVPTAVRFAPDGRVFVAEKSGRIQVFDDASDPAPTELADLGTEVHNSGDRGLLGLELDPEFPEDPFLYVSYTHDAEIGGEAPFWDDVCEDSDPDGDGCLVSGRLARLEVPPAGAPFDPEDVADSEQVLIEDWCQQYKSHSIGAIAFGPDGALYLGGGDGASFGFLDYGQNGGNACGDPPGEVGDDLELPDAEGGSLRSQDLLTPDDPTGLDGTVIRVDPEDGSPYPGNPVAGPDENARRIVAYGLRNPFRIALRPGTSEVWIADVGRGGSEEIDRLGEDEPEPVNFGWPCYEGGDRQPQFEGLGLDLCNILYDAEDQGEGRTSGPHLDLPHNEEIVPGEDCPNSHSSLSGLAFYDHDGEGGFPGSYRDGLFFSDFMRSCIWVAKAGDDGLPDPDRVEVFAERAAGPVDLQVGPDGALYYVALVEGEIRRIEHVDAEEPPEPPAPDPPPEAEPPDPNAAPAPRIARPQPRARYQAGKRIRFRGSATDPEDGELGASALDWELVLRRCGRGGCEDRSLRRIDGAPSGSLTVPEHRIPGHLVLRLTATDSAGRTGATSVRLKPRKVRLRLKTNRPAHRLTLAVDRNRRRAPFRRQVLKGSRVVLKAPGRQVLRRRGMVFRWRAWSNGGARRQAVVAKRSRTYRARYAARRLPGARPRR